MTKTTICDLPPKLVGEKILTKVSITSLGAVRSTCKLWESLSKEWILGKEATKQQFMGFMTKDSKVCSLRFQHRKDEGLVDLSIKQVDLLNQVEISKVFQCDGLLLCVTKDHSSLVAWNPYFGQTARYHTAFIIGEDGYFKSVSLGEAPNVFVPDRPIPPGGYIPQILSPPLVCSSSYLPSLVQLNQPRKRKERDW